MIVNNTWCCQSVVDIPHHRDLPDRRSHCLVVVHRYTYNLNINGIYKRRVEYHNKF